MCITFLSKHELLHELNKKSTHKRNVELLRLLYTKVNGVSDKRVVTFTISKLEMNEKDEVAYKNILENCVVKLGGNVYNNSEGCKQYG